jgi:hypothetical protein
MCRTCEAHDHADWPGEKRLEGRERKAEYIRPIYGRNYVAASHLPRTAPTLPPSAGGALGVARRRRVRRSGGGTRTTGLRQGRRWSAQEVKGHEGEDHGGQWRGGS